MHLALVKSDHRAETMVPEDTVAFGRFLQMLNQVINSPPIPDGLGTYFFGIPNAVLN